MESTISNALLLLVVGMSSVFFILFLVVTGGNLLIKLINKVEVASPEVPFARIPSDTIDASKIAIIAATVEAITHGKGRVDKIEKL
jgi:oxaloacetate decarboxylase (Na+ extruding) subunit gamma